MTFKRSILCGLILFWMSSFIPVHAQPESSIQHIQSILSSSSTYTERQEVRLDSPVEQRNLIVVAVSAYASKDADISSVTDSSGNTYTRIISNPENPSGHHHISIWATNALKSEALTIMATAAGSSYVTVAAHEYKGAGLSAVNPLIVGNSGSTSAASTSSISVQSQDLLFSAFMHEVASTPVATTGFALRQSQLDGTFESLLTQDTVASESAVRAATVAWDTPIPWKGVMAAFHSTEPTGIPLTSTPTLTPSPAATQGAAPGAGLLIESTDTFFSEGSSTKAETSGSTSSAALKTAFSDPASSHTALERPGTYVWQKAKIFIPSTTVNQLSGNEYLDIAGSSASEGGHLWHLRLKERSQLYAVGSRYDGVPVEFNISGTIPTDRWIDLEIGLHSQNGPGVKRAFAVLIDGHFYGWYNQGRMDTETYDSMAFGILETNSADKLEVYIDDVQALTNGTLPAGSDLRPTEQKIDHSFMDASGENVQMDLGTWQNDIKISSQSGIYSGKDRVQSGVNLDKMPDLTNGWAEVEIGWNGTPPANPKSYFGPMISFLKEINREENMEIVPIGNGDGTVDLTLETWTNGMPKVLAKWPLKSIPKQGDKIKVRWQMMNEKTVNVKGSYYDTTSGTWNQDIISGDFPVSNLDGGVNLNDGFHKAVSFTVDTSFYSIQRSQIGTLATY